MAVRMEVREAAGTRMEARPGTGRPSGGGKKQVAAARAASLRRSRFRRHVIDNFDSEQQLLPALV